MCLSHQLAQFDTGLMLAMSRGWEGSREPVGPYWQPALGL